MYILEQLRNILVPVSAAPAAGARRVELLPHQQADPVLLLQEHLPLRHRALVRHLLCLVSALPSATLEDDEMVVITTMLCELSDWFCCRELLQQVIYFSNSM